MKYGSRDGKEGGQYIGIDIVAISKIFAMLDAFFFGTSLLNGVYELELTIWSHTSHYICQSKQYFSAHLISVFLAQNVFYLP